MSHNIQTTCDRCGATGHHTAECTRVLGSLGPASGSAWAHLIGRYGQFTSATGQICQCVVRGIEQDSPIADDLLIVDYVKPDTGEKVTKAYIHPDWFTPDTSPSPPPVDNAYVAPSCEQFSEQNEQS